MKRAKVVLLSVSLAGLMLVPLLACDTIYDPDVVQEYTEVRGTVRIDKALKPLLPSTAEEGDVVAGCPPGNCYPDDEVCVLPDIIADEPALVVRGKIAPTYQGVSSCYDPGTVWFRFKVDKKSSLTMVFEWENAPQDAFVPILYERKEGSSSLTFLTWDLNGQTPITFNLVVNPKSQYYLRWLKWYQTATPTAYKIQLSTISGTVVGQVLVGAYADDEPYKIVPKDYPSVEEAGLTKYPVGGTTVRDLRRDEANCDSEGSCDLVGWFDGLLVPVMQCNDDNDCVPPICTDLKIPRSDPRYNKMCAPSPCQGGFCTFYVFAFADNDGGNNLDFSVNGPPSSADFIMAQTVAVPGGRVDFSHHWKLYTMSELLIDSPVEDPDFDAVPETDLNGDGLPDDNCPSTYNPNQADVDADGVGDMCDNCRNLSNPGQENSYQLVSEDESWVDPGDACNQDYDSDQDEVEYRKNAAGKDEGDNCPTVANTDQENLDNDGFGDACDPDDDNDRICDPGQAGDEKNPCTGSDDCQWNANPEPKDYDNDGVGEACDNCRGDMSGCLTDLDLIGKALASDDPRALWEDSWAECQKTATLTATECPGLDQICREVACADCKDQAADCYGYSGCKAAEVAACEAELARCIDTCDRFPRGTEKEQQDCYDACKSKRDSCLDRTCSRSKYDRCAKCMEICEGLCDATRNECEGNGARCEGVSCSEPNADQQDTDRDGIGDACDADIDGDGISNDDEVPGCVQKPNSTEDADGDAIPDGCDNCEENANPDQTDSDGDGAGDFCDNCTDAPNPGQEDLDGDLLGDACDPDDDNDGICDPGQTGDEKNPCTGEDNCPDVPNQNQADADADTVGDACDNCPADGNQEQADSDGDGIGDACDNCPMISNPRPPCETDDDCKGAGDTCGPEKICPSQRNHDALGQITPPWKWDELGNACDPDDDGDEVCDPGVVSPACVGSDNCPVEYNPNQIDSDSDGLGDACDNCPNIPNPDQADSDDDKIGDVCDSDNDGDGDGVVDGLDNCPAAANPNQQDSDGDDIGDACDPCPLDPDRNQDSDGDGVGDACGDNCPAVENPSQADTDTDGQGDACDTDDDNDGIRDTEDNCPLEGNFNQVDADQDKVGDACDNCPAAANPDQSDVDRDGFGDACDPDADGDGVFNDGDGSGNPTDNPCTGGETVNCDDNCPLTPNPGQEDLNGNLVGDACEVAGELVYLFEEEPNDDPSSGLYQDLGTLGFGNIYRLVGDMTQVGNNPGSPSWPWVCDEDWYVFDVSSSGTLEITFDWVAAASDYDMLLWRLDGSQLTLISQAGATGAKPELSADPVVAGNVYFLTILGYEGSPGVYIVDMEIKP